MKFLLVVMWKWLSSDNTKIKNTSLLNL